MGYCKLSNGYVFYIPQLKRVVTRRDAAFNEGHLPGSVGETSVVSIGDKPGIKLDARPVDIQPTTTKITTTTTKDSAKSGGKPTTTKDSKNSGGFVPPRKDSIIRLTGKKSHKEYINKRLALISGLRAEKSLDVWFYDESKGFDRKYNKSDLAYDKKCDFIDFDNFDNTTEKKKKKQLG